MRKYSLKDRLALIKLIKQGYPAKRLSKEVGVAYTSVRDWIRIYDLFGTEGLRNSSKANYVPSTEKERMCRLFLEKDVPLSQIYIPNGVSRAALKSWIRKVREGGYEALYGDCRCNNRPLNMVQSENEILREELKKAQHENLVLRAENALLKKVKALMEEEESRLKAFGRKPSRN